MSSCFNFQCIPVIVNLAKWKFTNIKPKHNSFAVSHYLVPPGKNLPEDCQCWWGRLAAVQTGADATWRSDDVGGICVLVDVRWTCCWGRCDRDVVYFVSLNCWRHQQRRVVPVAKHILNIPRHYIFSLYRLLRADWHRHRYVVTCMCN